MAGDLRSEPEAATGPERAYLFDRIQAWAVVGLVVLAGVTVAVAAFLGPDPWAAPLWVPIAGVFATRPARRAWALSCGHGRFVLVVADGTVIGTSGRWFARPWIPLRRGSWLHLLDPNEERSLGWVEVAPREAKRIRAIGAAALFGNPMRRGGAVLVGPFRPAQMVGRSRPALPVAYFRIAGRLRPSHIRANGWRLPPSPPLDHPARKAAD